MSYEMIDRFLRNNLGDDDYAEYSAALEAIASPQAALAEPSEPVYWQWRRKDKPWANEYIFAMELQATTDDSEVRKLFTHPASKPEPLTDEEILLAISPFYKDTLTRRAAIEVSIDEYRAIEQAVISRIKP